MGWVPTAAMAVPAERPASSSPRRRATTCWRTSARVVHTGVAEEVEQERATRSDSGLETTLR